MKNIYQQSMFPFSKNLLSITKKQTIEIKRIILLKLKRDISLKEN